MNKPLRGLWGLGAAIVVLASLSLVVALSTASATRLCNQEGTAEKCLGKIYITKTPWEAELPAMAKSVVQEGYATVECSASTMKGVTTSEGGGLTVDVTLNVESFTWGSCNCGKMEATGLPWKFSISGTGNKDGEFFGTFNLKTECGGETCLFNEFGLSPLRGGKTARIEIADSFVPQKGSGGKCANPSKWTATYDFKTPTPLFVTKE